jgi:hypothetical protein
VRASWWLVVGSAALVLAVCGGGSAFYLRLSDPEQTVAAFFAALADRDAEAALSRTTSTTSRANGATPVPILPSQALRSTDYQPPSDLVIHGSDRQDQTAKVEVGYRIGAKTVTKESLELRREFPRWLIINGGVGRLPVEVPGAKTLRVNGVEVATGPDRLGRPVSLALPGGYKVSVPDNPLTEAGSLTAAVHAAPFAAAPQKLEARLRPGVADHVNQLVRQYLDECAARKQLEPSGCPMRLTLPGVTLAGDPKWTIDRYPPLQVSLAGPVECEVYSLEQGKATIAVPLSLPGKTSTYTDDLFFSVSGRVTVSGNGLAFKPRIN